MSKEWIKASYHRKFGQGIEPVNGVQLSKDWTDEAGERHIERIWLTIEEATELVNSLSHVLRNPPKLPPGFQ